MPGLNFVIHYNKVEIYVLIFRHILFYFTLGRKTALSQPIMKEVALNYTYYKRKKYFFHLANHIGRVMVSVLASSVVGRGFESQSGPIRR